MKLFNAANSVRKPAAAVARTARVEGLETRQLFNGTLATATDLGTITGLQQRNDSVASAGDAVDDFKIKLGYAGKLTVRLTNLTGNADLRVIKDKDGDVVYDAGETIASSTKSGTQSEEIVLSGLSAGTYYLQAKRVSGSPSYKLAVKADYAGNAFAAAQNLGTFTGTKVRAERVDAEDTNDFFKFTLTSAKQFNVTTSGSGDAQLELSKDKNNNGVYDAGQDFLYRNHTPGTSTENISNITLGPGTYFVRISRGAADANYSMGLTIGN